MENNNTNKAENLIQIPCLAIISVVPFYIGATISFNTDISLTVVYGFLLIMALFWGITLISYKKTNCLLKFFISLLLSLPINYYFSATNYLLRSLNWVIPNYGYPSAGGKFATSFQWLCFAFFRLVIGVICLFIRPKKYKTFNKVRTIICISLAAITAVIVLALQTQFPKM